MVRRCAEISGICPLACIKAMAHQGQSPRFLIAYHLAAIAMPFVRPGPARGRVDPFIASTKLPTPVSAALPRSVVDRFKLLLIPSIAFGVSSISLPYGFESIGIGWVIWDKHLVDIHFLYLKVVYGCRHYHPRGSSVRNKRDCTAFPNRHLSTLGDLKTSRPRINTPTEIMSFPTLRVI